MNAMVKPFVPKRMFAPSTADEKENLVKKQGVQPAPPASVPFGVVKPGGASIAQRLPVSIFDSLTEEGFFERCSLIKARTQEEAGRAAQQSSSQKYVQACELIAAVI